MIDLNKIGFQESHGRQFKIVQTLMWYDGPAALILEDQNWTQFLAVLVDDCRENRLQRWLVSELTYEAIDSNEYAKNWFQLGSYILENRYEDDICEPHKIWFLAINTVPEEYLPAPQIKLSDYLKY